MAGSIDPKQIAQAGATNGQVLTYDTALGKWKPANSNAGFGFKAGTVAAGSFSGNPKTASVTFSTAYANTNYTISLCEVTSGNIGDDTHNITAQSKNTTGFTINLNSNQTNGLTEVVWQTSAYGEQ